MGSEADAEAATASAVDSDGSVSWEDFFGTSTDLVPQLLGMFDELARRGNGYGDHVVLPSSCSIPAALQKRLSLVQHSHRNSMLGQLCTENMKLRQDATMNNLISKSDCPADTVKEPEVREVTRCPDVREKSNTVDLDIRITNATDDREADAIDEKHASYRRESNGLTPLRYNRRCRTAGRPLSGSSIASSTSSSGCSNQGNTCTANPYLASVESLADTCASSQGSGDSGVVTVSETSCRIGNDANGQRRDSGVGDSMFLGPRYCDPHRNSVEKVLLEIVDTEAIYVEHLRQIIQGYLIFWRDDPTFLHQLRLNDLFGNIEDIFGFNREFLKEIEECGLDPIRVANTFIKHNGGFKVYTEYCTNYPRTVSVLTDLMSEEETACAFQERQAALGHALPLGAYLLTPVQRILKYRLLLEKLSKKYGADYESRGNGAEGLSAIEGALAAMADIANHINAMKRKHEHAVRVQEIQSLLYGWPGPDLTTCGELVAEGSFRMRGAKAPRHVFLFDRMLLLTKKKEDSLLVYKAHIMCSNLMLIESIPGEPLSFHVIPFDNPRLQYTLQARNLEQKREWTLQIKRVILENYNAVIPSHARNLVLQLGQTQSEDDIDRTSTKKQYSAPPEYLEKRKQERQRRRSEIGLKQKLKKGVRKSENGATTEDSPGASRKTEKDDPNTPDAQEQPLNRSSEGRASKVKDRFTNWRRKSEPGFQSYVSLNNSDEEQKEDAVEMESPTVETECTDGPQESEKTVTNSHSVEAKENNNEQQTQARTVEEIVGHILMENQEFQKLLEKQRNNSIINVRQQQRFNKHVAAAETSDESDSENTNYVNGSSNNNRCNRARAASREQRLIKTNNTWNSLSSPPARDNQPALQLLYNNLKTNNNNKSQQPTDTTANNKVNRVQEKKALFEAFKRQSIVTESKIIKTALRIRENSTSGNEDSITNTNAKDVGRLDEEKIINTENRNEKGKDVDESKGFGNYDNLQHVWEGLQEARDADGNDSPTRPAVWLNKLCEGLPTSPQKCGSLPRSFQISPPNSQPNMTKSRFLQRDGKPMSERPFTIASDKPAEINLEDMERYASSCQPEGRIAKFPTSVSASSSTFFCSLEDTYAEVNASPSTTNIHPEHKIYRANGNAVFRNVLSKAGSRLRNTLSTETLECKEEYERTKYFRSLSSNNGKAKRKSKGKQSRETSSDVEEMVGCVAAGTPNFPMPSLYYKQGSSGLGARIAQSDYADPSILFAENKRNAALASDQAELITTAEEPESPTENGESETDSFYERSFETIENYVDGDADDVFRDSAIFSDIDEVLVTRSNSTTSTGLASPKAKVAPAVPSRKKSASMISSRIAAQDSPKCKPSVARKPSYLKTKPTASRQETETKTAIASTIVQEISYEESKPTSETQEERFNDEDKDDVSAGQSQAGWVRKIVGQLQGQIET